MEDRIRDNFKGRRAGAFMHDEFEDDQEEMMEMRRKRLEMLRDQGVEE
jgi:hypothetical protein